MSTISTIHDELYSMLATLFPNKTQLADALVLENNLDTDKCDGYGINIADGRNTNRFVGCKMSIARTFDIVITKEVFASEQDKTLFKAAEKTMLEDHYKLLKEMEENSAGVDLPNSRQYINDTGLQRLFSNDGHKQFMIITTSFEIEYNENLT